MPALSVLAVIRETVHDEFVDVAEGEHLLRRALDGHGSQRDVRVRRLLVTVGVFAWPRHGVLNSLQYQSEASQHIVHLNKKNHSAYYIALL